MYDANILLHSLSLLVRINNVCPSHTTYLRLTWIIWNDKRFPWLWLIFKNKYLLLILRKGTFPTQKRKQKLIRWLIYWKHLFSWWNNIYKKRTIWASIWRKWHQSNYLSLFLRCICGNQVVHVDIIHNIFHCFYCPKGITFKTWTYMEWVCELKL